MSVVEDRLREAAALGDLDAVKMIVQSGKANVNHQNKMNGWTALHWAAKRNHSVVVAYLITSGSADDTLADFSGRLPGDVSDDPEVRSLLKVTEDPPPAARNCSSSLLPFTPNYLRNPMVHKEDYYTETLPADTRLHQQQSATAANNRRVSSSSSSSHHHPQAASSDVSRQRLFHDVSTSPAASTAAAGATSPGNNHVVVSSNHPHSNEPTQSTSAAGQQRTNPTKILKLKVEGERDFIEADLPLEEMNMTSLMSLVSSELRLNHGYIKYLRKLPDTKLRRDIDVARLNNYQEIEVVLLNN